MQAAPDPLNVIAPKVAGGSPPPMPRSLAMLWMRGIGGGLIGPPCDAQ